MLDISFGAYVRFFLELAFGLAGMGLVLTMLLEKLFNDWDVFGDTSRAIKKLSEGKRVSIWESVVQNQRTREAAVAPANSSLTQSSKESADLSEIGLA